MNDNQHRVIYVQKCLLQEIVTEKIGIHDISSHTPKVKGEYPEKHGNFMITELFKLCTFHFTLHKQVSIAVMASVGSNDSLATSYHASNEVLNGRKRDIVPFLDQNIFKFLEGGWLYMTT